MDFFQYAGKGNQLLDEVAEQLGFPGERDLAGRILRAVLHALRDRLPTQTSLKLLAQLPFAVKALYVDGWQYHEKPERIKRVRDFIKRVVHEDFPVSHHDFQSAKDGENAVMAVFNVLKSHISKGEIEDIIATMPPELRELWGQEYILERV